MKLHDAIVQTLLNEIELCQKKIAEKLNQTKIYIKKDQSEITHFQMNWQQKLLQLV